MTTEQTVLQDFVLTNKEFRLISSLVNRYCGINLHDGKQELVRARLAKQLRRGGFSTFSEYIEHVLNDRSGLEFSTLMDSLSTNVTGFFRENEHFQFLQTKFLPALIEKKLAKRNTRIRAWSAGCSSGEEPYSIAITLLDAAGDLGQWNIKVLATDISTQMLAIGRTGIYSKQRVAPLNAQQRSKYLVPACVDGQRVYEVNKTLRDTVVYRHLNLMDNWPIEGPLDFIFCRNVMIYFDKPTQGSLIRRFWDLLDSGGILFTGHSESLVGIEHRFEFVQPSVYAKPQGQPCCAE